MNRNSRRKLMCMTLGMMLIALGAAVHAGDPPDVPERYAEAMERLVARAEQGIAAGPFKADFDDLAKATEAPEWFQDDKFGIYFHWGVYSVPAYGNEWYPRHMNRKGNNRNKHHIDTYGEPDVYPYTKFVPPFRAEHFDADAWAELFKRSGARYAGPVAEHHDGYAMWDSAVTPWNAADTGPKRDLTGELARAIRKRGMKFVATFHHARNNLWQHGKKWTGHFDGAKQHYPNVLDDPMVAYMYGYMPRERFEQMWLAKLVEVIDNYQPDLIWFDSWLHEISERRRAQFAAYYYNQAAQWGKDVVITRKQNDLPMDFSLVDYEKGRASNLTPNWWLTDDTISTGSWCYTHTLGIKPTQRVLHDFIDIVSKRGCLLLNISPKADGTIPQNQRDVLLEIGDWLRVNGEAIFDTRPWHVYGEGPTRMSKGGHFVRGVTYGPRDIRYTRSKDGRTLYAIVLGWPGDQLTLRSVNIDHADDATVTMFGHGKPLNYHVNDGQLTIDVPDLAENQRPGRYAYAFKLSGFTTRLKPGVDPNAPAPPTVSKDLTLDAGEASLRGNLGTETSYGGRNLGFWDSGRDKAVWQVLIKDAGRYRVTAVLAAPEASRLAVQVADQTLVADTPATGGYGEKQTVELGVVTVANSGKHTVVAKPANPKQWNAINLWKLQLASID